MTQKFLDRYLPWTALMLWIIWILTMVFLYPSLWFSQEGYESPENHLLVKEEDGTSWADLSQLNIFPSNMEKNFLVPESCGSYTFIVENEAQYPVAYKINVNDENICNIPMSFRLRDISGNFIIGNESQWCSISELDAVPGKLDYQGSTRYTLDWHWDSSSDQEDTLIGVAAQAKLIYTLNFLIVAEQAGPVIESGLFGNSIGWTDCWLAFLITLLILFLLLLVTGITTYFYIKRKFDHEANPSDNQENTANM